MPVDFEWYRKMETLLCYSEVKQEHNHITKKQLMLFDIVFQVYPLSHSGILMAIHVVLLMGNISVIII